MQGLCLKAGGAWFNDCELWGVCGLGGWGTALVDVVCCWSFRCCGGQWPSHVEPLDRVNLPQGLTQPFAAWGAGSPQEMEITAHPCKTISESSLTWLSAEELDLGKEKPANSIPGGLGMVFSSAWCGQFGWRSALPVKKYNTSHRDPAETRPVCKSRRWIIFTNSGLGKRQKSIKCCTD